MSVASSCLPPASSSSFRRLLPPAASCRLLPRSPPLRHPRRPRCPRPTAIRDPQCSLPDLNHDHPRPVFPAGPQPRPSPPSVPCRTSTATIPAQCSLPDLNRDHPRPVFPAGPQPRVSTPKDMPHRVPEDMPDRMLEDMPDRMPDRMPENMSDRMPEDLPVTKCINVMVGITRSKVIYFSFSLSIYNINRDTWLYILFIYTLFVVNHKILYIDIMYTSKQLQSVTFCYMLVHTTTYIQLHAYNYLQLRACNYITPHAFTLPCLTLHAYAPLSQHIYLHASCLV